MLSKNNNRSDFNAIFGSPDKIIKRMYEQKSNNQDIISFNLVILIFTLLYGAITGFFIGGTQILINAIKIPIIVFGLIYSSLPIFYVFNLFIAKKMGLNQIAIIILSGFSITTLIMVAFAPLILLFSVTTGNVHFIILINICIGVLALSCGLFYIYHIFTKIHKGGIGYWFASLFMGYFVIFFSAPQLLWALRPYFHSIDSFIEPIKSNFYLEIFKVIAQEPLLTPVLVIVFSLVGFFIFINISDDQETKTNYHKEQSRIYTRKKRKLRSRGNGIKPGETYTRSLNKYPKDYQYYQYPQFPPYYYPYYNNQYKYGTDGDKFGNK